MSHRHLALIVLGLVFCTAPDARSQATGTEYVTFWQGDLRVFATEPQTRIEVIDIDTGSPALGAVTLVNAGDSLESSTPGIRHVLVRSSDASGAGVDKPIVVWTGRLEGSLKHPAFTPFTSNPWMSYIPAILGSELRNGSEVGREFLGFASRDAYFFARRGPDPTLIDVQDLLTNRDPDSDDSQLLTPLSPALIHQDAELEVYRIGTFEDDTIRVSSNVDLSILAGIAPERAGDWSASAPSHAPGDEGRELGTLFYTFVHRQFAVFPTENDTTVQITDLSDGDDSRTVFLANGDLANPRYDFYTPNLSVPNGTGIVGRPFNPQVNLVNNHPNAMDDDLVRIESDKPVIVYVGPVGSDVNEFADVASSIATGPSSRLVYVYAQNGGAHDLQVFVTDPTTNVRITSLSRTLGFGFSSHHDAVLPPYLGGNLLTEDWYWSSPLWSGEMLRIESDKPLSVIGGDYDSPNFGAFIPFTLTTPLLPPIAVAVGPETACPDETVTLDGSGSFDQDAILGGLTETWSWDCDVAVDSDGNGIPDDDLDGTGETVDCTYGDDGTRVARLTFTDDDGQSDTDEVTTLVSDEEPPTFTTCPGDVRLDCADALPTDRAQATDDCGVPLVSLLETRQDGPCPQAYTLTREWTAVDDFGNESTCVQVIEVSDTTPPELIVPEPLTLECDSPGGIDGADPRIQAWLAEATASDDCGGVSLVNDAPGFFPSGCASGVGTAVTFTATDDCGLVTELTAVLTVEDTTPPELTVAEPLTLECDSPGGIDGADPRILAWLAEASATDLCGAATVSHDAPAFFGSGCAPGADTVVTFTATDDCGLITELTAVLTVEDTTPPELTVPEPLTLECDSPGGIDAADPRIQAWLAEAAASDLCGSASVVHDAPAFFGSGCAPGAGTVVTFTATDDCGLITELTAVLTVEDTTPPELTVPEPLTLECDSPGGIDGADPRILAWLAEAAATDLCGAATVAHDAPAFFGSGCAPGADTVVTFTATDDCGLTTVLTSVLTVEDTTPPELVVPEPLTLECNEPGGVSGSDPAVQAWLASAFGSDACGGVVIAHDAPAFFPSGCAPETTTPVLFTATDDCGLVTMLSSSITVSDTTPPEVTASDEDLECLWPPNHWYVCFSREDFAPTVSDACGTEPVTWRFSGCSSNQPDNGDGDGNTINDCVISPEGDRLCARAERQGGDPDGRRYAVSIVATDGCGNESEPTQAGYIYVPHDQDPPETGCRNPTKTGIKPRPAPR